jgi:hypothetical protein
MSLRPEGAGGEEPEGLLGGPDNHRTFRVPGEGSLQSAHEPNWRKVLEWSEAILIRQT